MSSENQTKYSTRLLFHDDSYLFNASGIVMSVKRLDQPESLKYSCLDGHLLLGVFLDQTIFHPQGGGQPSDQGTLNGHPVVGCRFSPDPEHGMLSVEHVVQLREGQEAFQPGQVVALAIDAPTRELYVALHSTGHLIDVAMSRLGQRLVPSKGNHAARGSFVEYSGEIPASERSSLALRLQEEVQHLIESYAEQETQIRWFANAEELSAAYEGQTAPSVVSFPTRIVTLGIPCVANKCACGGTHIKKISDLERFKISIGKIQKKGQAVRISYKVERK